MLHYLLPLRLTLLFEEGVTTYNSGATLQEMVLPTNPPPPPHPQLAGPRLFLSIDGRLFTARVPHRRSKGDKNLPTLVNYKQCVG